MEAFIEIVIEGFKKFGGEIIGGILLTLALWIFPGMRRILTHDAEPGTSGANFRKAVIFAVLVVVAVMGFAGLWKVLRNTDIKPAGHEQADAGEQYELGNKYYNVKNYEQAVYHYRKAAQQGNSDAQYNLGVMYANGYGVPQDYGEALRLYRLSAEQGNAQAQCNLGNMYEHGEGVAKNLQEARKYYQLAATQGHEDAKSALKRLK